MSYENVKDNITDIEFLKVSLEEAVKRQLMSDVPYGALLSGGLDSSIITAIAAKFSTPLHSFAIGLEGSPDLAASWIQLTGYGTGFLSAVWKRLILNKGEFKAFEKKFYD
jgi:asparagine synthetase B (glutamine-hydrolysing)